LIACRRLDAQRLMLRSPVILFCSPVHIDGPASDERRSGSPTTGVVGRSTVVCLMSRVLCMNIGIIHPGEMGAVLASAAECPVMWASEARSDDSRRRARENGVVDVGTMVELVNRSDVLVSVCPPHAAMDVASDVERIGFDGIFVDANAVSPATVREIAIRFDRFVDGGIIGPPPRESGTTRLYLAGLDASTVASGWENSSVDVRVLPGRVGSASAMKAAYAGWTKGSAALLLAVRAYATANGLDGDIVDEWRMSIPGLAERSDSVARTISRKAWRFEGEMAEIAEAMGDAGLPDGFHAAASEIYHRLAHLKGHDTRAVDEVNAILLGEHRDPPEPTDRSRGGGASR
jgi:3-hydroxyisobutyrate dehydrogenase-like beta-hydroxyacid dehydrogenase